VKKILLVILLLFIVQLVLSVPGDVLYRFPNGTVNQDFNGTMLAYNGQNISLLTNSINNGTFNYTTRIFNTTTYNLTFIYEDTGVSYSAGKNLFIGFTNDTALDQYGAGLSIGTCNTNFNSYGFYSNLTGCTIPAQAARSVGNHTITLWWNATASNNNVKMYVDGVLNPENGTHNVSARTGNLFTAFFYHGNSIGENTTIRNFTICDTYCGVASSTNTTVNITIQGAFQNISAELNSPLSLNATNNLGVVCIDIIHPSYGINYTCANLSTFLSFNISFFERSILHDGNITRNLSVNSTRNQTINISAHQFDEVDSLKISILGHKGGTNFPTNVKIYVNGTLSNNIGLLQNITSGELNSFNDTDLNKSSVFILSETRIIGYFRLPKNANMTSSYVNFTGSSDYSLQETANNISSSQSSNEVLQNYTKPSSASNNSVWQVYYNNAGTNSYTNLSFSASCWNYNETKMLTKITSGTGSVVYSCYNGTAWHTLLSAATSGCTPTASCSPSYPSGQALVSVLYDGLYTTGAQYTGTYNDWCSSACSDRIIVYEDAMYWNIAPLDPWMEVGVINGSKDWNYTSTFNVSNNRSNNFSGKIMTFLNECTEDSEGYCNVPMYVYSTGGTINITGLKLQYDFNINPVVISRTIVEAFLNGSRNTTTIPITFTSSENGTIELKNISYKYAGGNNTIQIIAHTSDYVYNKSIAVTYHHSRWNFSFPRFVSFLEFIPKTPTSKNITPFGQTTNTAIFKMNNLAYGGKNYNFSIYINESMSCVNISAGNSSNSTLKILLTPTNWTYLSNNITYLQPHNIFLFADYSCNSTTGWRLLKPKIYLRACAEETICSNATT